MKQTLLMLGVGLLCGCVGQPAQTPPLPVPQSKWSAHYEGKSGNPNQWLHDFDAPGLSELIQTALDQNFDLQIAEARLAAARARARIAGAPRWPNAELGAQASRRRATINDSPDNVIHADSFSLDATVSWEVDVWGRLGDVARAAGAEAQAADADYRGARLLLAANVARGWFGVIEAELQVALADGTLESFRRSNAVIEERYRRGLVTALDVRLARENVASAESVYALRQRAREERIRALEVLLGNLPVRQLATIDQLPTVNRAVPAGLPSDLLVRRPDLVAGERRLQAAVERLDAARKNRLPGIRLTASGGTASTEMRNLLQWDYLVWSLLGSITQPLFAGDRRQAEDGLARAEHREDWAFYARTVLTALQEVETALASESLFIEQETALSHAAREAKAAAELAMGRYERGLVNIITLQETQRRAFTAESALLVTARERLNNRVSLYLALGGDFDQAMTGRNSSANVTGTIE